MASEHARKCEFNTVGNFWVCKNCATIVPKRANKKPLATCKCVKFIQPKTQPDPKSRVLREYNRFDSLPNSRETVKQRLTICVACDKFNGQTCTERGSPCRYYKRWLERLFFGRCKKWT